jgi:hypothetical protein
MIGLALWLVAGMASAQQPTQAQANAVKQSCRSDYQSHCASVPTGGRAALNCLQEHLTDLSPPCQNAVSAAEGGAAPNSRAASQAQPMPAPAPQMSMRQEAALLRRSCGADFRSYCQGVQPGGGRALECLAQNQQRLSPSCKGALAEAHGGR